MIKIVIIEDLPMFLDGLKLIISMVVDFEIVGEFNNGKEFIDNIDQIETDIVLTDIDMPVMDGIATTKLTQSLKPSFNIIGLSSHNDRKYYYEMVTAGAKGFILKQSPSNELETAIREVYNGGNYFSAELLRTVIVEMQSIENEIIKDKIDLLKLNQRETEILNYLCQGLSNSELSEKLFVSVSTVENTKTKLMKKTKTRNNAGLIIWAIKNKIVSI